MLNIFNSKATSKNIESKNMLNKELFNSTTKKDIITKAARESAEDQKRMLESHKKILQSDSACASH